MISSKKSKRVSALAAEWIEIGRTGGREDYEQVSALAAEWIEILHTRYIKLVGLGLRPRGGVD